MVDVGMLMFRLASSGVTALLKADHECNPPTRVDDDRDGVLS